MALSTIDEAIAAIAARVDGRRGRRRGPRERGRPHHGRRGRDPRAHGLLPRAHVGGDLRAAGVVARRRARPAADGRGQHRGPAHRVHRDGRLPPRHVDGHLGARPRGDRARAGRPGDRGRPTSTARATSSRCATAAAACSSAPATPRPTVDLCRLAGQVPARHALRDRHRRQVRDGAARPSSRSSPQRHGLPIVSIADLIRYRRQHEKLVRRVAEATLPTEHGQLPTPTSSSRSSTASSTWRSSTATSTARTPLVRVHSECLTGDVLGSLRCDCGPQLQTALAKIAAEGIGDRGVPARPRGPRHRPRPQDPGVRAPRGRARHRRRQPRARPAGRHPRVRDRRADPGRPGGHRRCA